MAASRKPRPRISDLQDTIQDLERRCARLRTQLAEKSAAGEWTAMDQSKLCRYQAFVRETCKQMHLPCSYVLTGIEEGELHNLSNAMHNLEQTVIVDSDIEAVGGSALSN